MRPGAICHRAAMTVDCSCLSSHVYLWLSNAVTCGNLTHRGSQKPFKAIRPRSSLRKRKRQKWLVNNLFEQNKLRKLRHITITTQTSPPSAFSRSEITKCISHIFMVEPPSEPLVSVHLSPGSYQPPIDSH